MCVRRRTGLRLAAPDGAASCCLGHGGLETRRQLPSALRQGVSSESRTPKSLPPVRRHPRISVNHDDSDELKRVVRRDGIDAAKFRLGGPSGKQSMLRRYSEASIHRVLLCIQQSSRPL